MVKNLLCALLSHNLSFLICYQPIPLLLMFPGTGPHHLALCYLIGFFSLQYTFDCISQDSCSVVLLCLNYCSVFSSVSFNKFYIPASQPVSLILLPLLIHLQVLGRVVKVLCYKSEGRLFDPRWCHWNFSLT